MNRLAEGRYAEVFTWDDGEVLKLYREGYDLSEIELEADNARAVVKAGVPAPRVIDVVQWKGRNGIVFERVAGPRLVDALVTQKGEAAALGWMFGELHARVHASHAAVRTVQRERLIFYIDRAPGITDVTRSAARQALAGLPDGDALCHGDFHPLNVILAESGPVVVDWAKSSRGDPEADVARTLMLLSLTPMPRNTSPAVARAIDEVRAPFASAYRKAYSEIRTLSTDRVNAWTLPVAVARIGRGVSVNEQAQLVSFVDGLLRPGGPK